MSTLAYAQLTNARESASPGTSTTVTSPGMKTYIDAFAALVPAEVLTLHALIISVSTRLNRPSDGTSSVGIGSAILPDALFTLQVSFWGLIALSMVLYAAPRYFDGKWDQLDWIRISIAPLAFVGWTMLQRTTAFDAISNLQDPARTVSALFLGAVLGGVTSALALIADKKTP